MAVRRSLGGKAPRSAPTATLSEAEYEAKHDSAPDGDPSQTESEVADIIDSSWNWDEPAAKPQLHH